MFLIFPAGRSGKNRGFNIHRRNVAAIIGIFKMGALFTVKQFIAKHQAFTNGGIRALIFNAHQNGLAKSGAMLRIGRKVLIDEVKFFTWLEAQNKGGE
jgi:hypothetical protein